MSIIKRILFISIFILTISTSQAFTGDLKKIGKFKDWEVMTMSEASGKVCFAQSIPVLQAPKKNKLDLAQMSLKFLEIQPFVTSVIIGATTMDQLKTNIESVNINLTNEIINEINEVQKIYPNPCP